jgi:hypothetical protein
MERPQPLAGHLAWLGIALWGYALIHTPIDAIPDLSETR